MAKADFNPSDLVKKKDNPGKTPSQGGSAHPGFKAVEKKVAKTPGIRDPGAVVAAAARKASPAAKRANPRLKRVSGA